MVGLASAAPAAGPLLPLDHSNDPCFNPAVVLERFQENRLAWEWAPQRDQVATRRANGTMSQRDLVAVFRFENATSQKLEEHFPIAKPLRGMPSEARTDHR